MCLQDRNWDSLFIRVFHGRFYQRWIDGSRISDWSHELPIQTIGVNGEGHLLRANGTREPSSLLYARERRYGRWTLFIQDTDTINPVDKHGPNLTDDRNIRPPGDGVNRAVYSVATCRFGRVKFQIFGQYTSCAITCSSLIVECQVQPPLHLKQRRRLLLIIDTCWM